MEDYKDIERSIIKTYRKNIWSKFIKGINTYDLINENDRIMVCISGGKDSFLLAKCMQELKRHGKVNFDIKFVVMNPGYDDESMKLILDNAKRLNVPIEIFESPIFKVVKSTTDGNPCYLCARMRRGYLYDYAQSLGCNKIALGHHFDDVVETVLLSMFYGSEVKIMLPKLHSDNFEGLELIRPLYYVEESSIKSWRDKFDLEFVHCACPLFGTCGSGGGKRFEMKQLINKLRELNPDIPANIIKALDNVNLSCVLGYKKDGEYNSFLDNY